MLIYPSLLSWLLARLRESKSILFVLKGNKRAIFLGAKSTKLSRQINQQGNDSVAMF